MSSLAPRHSGKCLSTSADDDVAIGAQPHTSANLPEQFRVVLRMSRPFQAAWQRRAAVSNRLLRQMTTSQQVPSHIPLRTRHLSTPLSSGMLHKRSHGSVDDDVAAQVLASANPPEQFHVLLRTTPHTAKLIANPNTRQHNWQRLIQDTKG